MEVRFNTTLRAIEAVDGRVGRVRLSRTVQRRPGDRPEVLKGQEAVLPVDLVVAAMGYRTDPAFAGALPGTPVRREASGLADRRWQATGILAHPAPPVARNRPVGMLARGRESALVTSALPFRERTWVAGDALVGPSTVVEAMAHGRWVAQAILGGRPRRPGGLAAVPRRALVAYESRSGHTRRAAEAISLELAGHISSVVSLPLDRVGPGELAACDLLVVGTWVEGFVVAGVGPAKATRKWLAGLPQLAGKPVAVYCTYGVSPRGTLPSIRRALEAKGAVVVGQAAFGPRELAKAGPFGPAAVGRPLATPAAAPRAAAGVC